MGVCDKVSGVTPDETASSAHLGVSSNYFGEIPKDRSIGRVPPEG